MSTGSNLTYSEIVQLPYDQARWMVGQLKKMWKAEEKAAKGG